MFSKQVAETGRVLVPALLGAGAMALPTASADGDVLHAAQYPWSHSGVFSSYDSASMKFVHYRNLVGVCYTEDEAKALASEIEVADGPDDNGEMFDRPGKLNDAFPSPYENEEQARAINNGALPPDLSLITKSRHDGQNYLFALLTGYKDPPAGVVVNEEAGQYYNPYFPGGKIGMPKQLMDGAVEYGDGTPSTVSQMAKDVTTFLTWAAEPHHDERKRVGNKIIVALLIAASITGWYKRFRWAPLKTRKISYKS